MARAARRRAEPAARASRCSPDSVTCGVAACPFCASTGDGGGGGPIEVSGTDVAVVFLGP